MNRAIYGQQASQFEIDKRSLQQSVANVYYELQYQQAQVEVYRQLDSLYQQFAHAAKRRFELGETNYLEKITAQAKQKQLETRYKQAQDQIAVWFEKLRPLINTDLKIVIVPAPLQKLEVTNPGIQNNPGLDFYKNRSRVFAAQFGMEKQQLLPDISLTYFQWDNNAIKTPLKGYQVGIHIPVLFFGNSSKIKAANIAKRAAEQERADYKVRLNSEYNQLIQQMIKHQKALSYYENEGKGLSEEIIKTATLSYKSGEIDFFEYIQSLENSYAIILSYYENLNAYNQVVTRINYLTL